MSSVDRKVGKQGELDPEQGTYFIVLIFFSCRRLDPSNCGLCSSCSSFRGDGLLFMKNLGHDTHEMDSRKT